MRRPVPLVPGCRGRLTLLRGRCACVECRDERFERRVTLVLLAVLGLVTLGWVTLGWWAP